MALTEREREYLTTQPLGRQAGAGVSNCVAGPSC